MSARHQSQKLRASLATRKAVPLISGARNHQTGCHKLNWGLFDADCRAWKPRYRNLVGRSFLSRSSIGSLTVGIIDCGKSMNRYGVLSIARRT